LNKLREPQDLQIEIKTIENKKSELFNFIREILILEQHRPKSAKEIAQLLHKTYNMRYSRREVSQFLYSPEIKNHVQHCRITFTYTLKNELIKKANFNISNSQDLEIDTFVRVFENEDILLELQTTIRQNFFQISSGNTKFDDLVKYILRDNIITPTEELFLIEKANELNVSIDQIQKIKNSIHQNNPYFDNIIHLVYENENIIYNDLSFIREKIIEHNFHAKFFNLRFWQIGIKDYLNYLLQFEDFSRVIVLWKLNQIMSTSNTRIPDKLFFMALDVNTGNSIEAIIKNGLNLILNEFYITHKCTPDFINKITQKVIESHYLYRIPMQQLNLPKEIHSSEIQDLFIRIIEEEKLRIGSPAASLLAENIIFRIENLL
jgi:hypothetical protein